MPRYVIDERALRRNLEILKRVSDRTGAKILLAQKAYSCAATYPLCARYLAGTTASSLFEARHGRDSFGGETHVFSPAFAAEEMDELLSLVDHLVFNSPRQFPDGRFANTTWTLDRDGDLIASYDKAFPTPREMEWKEFKTVPGEKAVVCDTDFGRLGFVTCFDLNFTHFADEYRPLAPDVMVFCSY